MVENPLLIANLEKCNGKCLILHFLKINMKDSTYIHEKFKNIDLVNIICS
jgi:hypothetical protein